MKPVNEPTPPEPPWLHIGECPVCVDGLCRVRICHGTEPAHLFAVCDECETMWVEPTTESPKHFDSVEEPTCPICHAPLYGEQSEWASVADLHGSSWAGQVIIDFPTADLATEDETARADSPTTPAANHASEIKDSDSVGSDDPLSDPTYGQDDPRPGC